MKHKSKFMHYIPNLFEENIVAACFIIMTVLLALGFISRLLPFFSFAFTEEIVVQLYLLATIFAISSCVIHRTHMSLTLFSDKLPKTAKNILLIIVYLINVAYFIFFGYQGLKLALSQMNYGLVTPVLRWVKWPFTISFPIGAALFIFRSTQQLKTDLKQTDR